MGVILRRVQDAVRAVVSDLPGKDRARVTTARVADAIATIRVLRQRVAKVGLAQGQPAVVRDATTATAAIVNSDPVVATAVVPVLASPDP